METSESRNHTAKVASGFIENQWYAIADAHRVSAKKPMTVERLGRRLVLWRDRDGRIAARDARCPHRGANLGLGRVVDGDIECPYHGFRFSGQTGACTLVPCEGRSYRAPRGMSLAGYRVAEKHGLVWLWWPGRGACGDVETGDLPEIPWFDELPDTLRGTCVEEMTWNVPYGRTAEGLLDIHHAPFAHRRAMPGVGTRLDPYTVEQDGDLIRTHGVLRKDDGKPYSGKGGFALGLTVRFPGLLMGTFGKRFRGVAAMTPVDGERTWIIYRYYYLTSFPIFGPIIGKLMAWIGVKAEKWFVQPDDQRLQESSTPAHFDTHDNHYVPSDAGILRWHKRYRARMRAQSAHESVHLTVLRDDPTPRAPDADSASGNAQSTRGSNASSAGERAVANR